MLDTWNTKYFDDLKNLVGKTWHTDASGSVNETEAWADTHAYTKRADHGFVVYENEQLLGACLVSCKPFSLLASDEAYSDTFVYEELQASEELIGTSWDEEDFAQILLLIVAPESKGKGIGKKLVNQAETYFLEQKKNAYCLVTDTDCDWSFYEHLNMKRIAEKRSAHPDAPCAYYVYKQQLDS